MNNKPDTENEKRVLLCHCGNQLTWHIEAANTQLPVFVQEGYLVVDDDDFADGWDIRDYYHEGLYCGSCREFCSVSIDPDDDLAEYQDDLIAARIRLEPEARR